MATGSKAGLYQNAQSASYLTLTLVILFLKKIIKIYMKRSLISRIRNVINSLFLDTNMFGKMMWKNKCIVTPIITLFWIPKSKYLKLAMILIQHASINNKRKVWKVVTRGLFKQILLKCPFPFNIIGFTSFLCLIFW